MYWQLTLALLSIIGIICAVRWFVVRADKRAMQELDDICLGAESSHAKPVHADDGRLIGFVRESRDG